MSDMRVIFFSSTLPGLAAWPQGQREREGKKEGGEERGRDVSRRVKETPHRREERKGSDRRSKGKINPETSCISTFLISRNEILFCLTVPILKGEFHYLLTRGSCLCVWNRHKRLQVCRSEARFNEVTHFGLENLFF